MTISIIGYYRNNFGDLLMLQGILNALPLSVSKVYVLTYGNVADIQQLYVGDCNIEVISILKKRFSFSLLKALWKSKFIIWGGGSCFNLADKGRGGIKWMRLFDLFSTKVVYWGVGIELDNEHRILKALHSAIKISTYMVLRDERSYEIAKRLHSRGKCKLLLSKDPIFLNNFVVSDDFDRNELVICWRNIENYNILGIQSREVLCQFCDNVTYFVNNYALSRVVILAADKDVDDKDSVFILDYLLRSDVAVVYNSNSSLQEKCEILNTAKYVVTGRLHIGVYSIMRSKKVCFLNYSQKNEAFVECYKLPQECLVEYQELRNKETINNHFSNMSDINAPMIDYDEMKSDFVNIFI